MNPALAQHIEESTETRLEHVRRSLHSTSYMLARAADTLLDSMMQGQRVALCARSKTLFLAQVASALLQRGMVQPRPSLPAMLLAPLPDERTHYPQHFGSLVSPGDVLWVFALSEHDELSSLIDSAHELGMKLIILSAPLPNTLSQQLSENDVLIQLSAPTPASLLESALSAVHAVCDALDQRLLGLI
ncbi:MAG: hypothetical protein B7Y40_10250 [Gammaproteobacteria bacterium 28-57-27]|nr:MAG: hypothetical protein B7Y40_10250 [Gammaproteobacteria bacterium 28-57-27]